MDNKKTYEEIKASKELKERVDKIIESELSKEDVRKSPFKNWGTALAASLVIFVSAVNISPSLAYAAKEIPLLDGLINVVTFNRFVTEENGYEAEIVTPQIEGLLDKELEDKLNEEFKEYSNVLIAGFEEDVREFKEEFGDETIHMGIESNYEVITDNKDFLSLDLYTLSTAGSSNTVHSFYNIDKASGKLLELKDLFKEDADYVEVISKYLTSEMERQNKEEDAMYWLDGDEEPVEGFKEIKEDQLFFINEANELVIAFDKYEVAPGASGNPMFTIPFEIIEDILAENSLIK